jgi:hypothetical protein
MSVDILFGGGGKSGCITLYEKVHGLNKLGAEVKGVTPILLIEALMFHMLALGLQFLKLFLRSTKEVLDEWGALETELHAQ